MKEITTHFTSSSLLYFIMSILLYMNISPNFSEATSLTYAVAAHEKACFYAWIDKPGEKIAFYFAVQTGGSFDIDYLVTDPKGKTILNGEKERQGDFIFTANYVGEYSFCFANDMSTFAEKLVDFEITVENEPRAELPTNNKDFMPDQTNSMEESCLKLSSSLSTIARTQKYFRTRENRNFSTVKSTENRIFWYSLLESALIVGMACVQRKRIYQEQLKSDLENAESMFRGVSIKGSPLDKINPRTRDEFDEFSKLLCERIKKHEVTLYVTFINGFVKELCSNLKDVEIRKLSSILSTLANEKTRATKEKGKKKNKPKPTLHAELDETADFGNYHDEYDDDFM
nr:493_t:CDS:2 [Entrophospora candida]